MKKVFLIFLSAVTFNAAVQAQSCKSLFSGAEPIFNKLAKEYIKFRMDAAKIIVPIVVPKLANAKEETDKLIDEATKMQIQLYNSYGIISGQSNMTIGAVDLIVPLKKWTGDLYTERTFTILNSPYDKIVITIKKTDGRRGVKFKACAKYSNGSPYDEKDGEIDKDANGTERTITFAKNMVDKNISLHLVASGSTPVNKCDYTLSIEGFFDNNEMQKIYDDNDLGNKNNNKGKGKQNQNGKQREMQKGGQQASANAIFDDTDGAEKITAAPATAPSSQNVRRQRNNGGAVNTQQVNNTKLDDLKNPFDSARTGRPQAAKKNHDEEIQMRKRGQGKQFDRPNSQFLGGQYDSLSEIKTRTGNRQPARNQAFKSRQATGNQRAAADSTTNTAPPQRRLRRQIQN